MKRIFWLCSAVGLSVVQANTAAANEGRISISSGDRQLNISVANQAISDDELNEAIARLAKNSQNFSTPANGGYAQLPDHTSVSYNSPVYSTQVPSYQPQTPTYQAQPTISYQAQPVTQTYQSQTYQSQPYQSQTAQTQNSGQTALSQGVVSALKSSQLSKSSAPSIAARVASRAAHSRSRGRCALYVRKALQSAGYEFKPQESAYMYATNGTLKGAGFVKISKDNYEPQVGDVVVWHRTAKHPHGHIQIYNGSGWVSDFNQPKFSPYSQPGSYTVWRDARYLDASDNQGTYLAMNDR